jgi:hypothetical protein
VVDALVDDDEDEDEDKEAVPLVIAEAVGDDELDNVALILVADGEAENVEGGGANRGPVENDCREEVLESAAVACRPARL